MENNGYTKVYTDIAKSAAENVLLAIDIINEKERAEVSAKLRKKRFTWKDVWLYDNVGFIDYYFRKKRHYTEDEVINKTNHNTRQKNFNGEANNAKAILDLVDAANDTYIWLNPRLSYIICYSRNISLDELEKMSYSEAYRYFNKA